MVLPHHLGCAANVVAVLVANEDRVQIIQAKPGIGQTTGQHPDTQAAIDQQPKRGQTSGLNQGWRCLSCDCPGF